MEGFEVTTMEHAVAEGNIFVTTTGIDVLTQDVVIFSPDCTLFT